MPMYKATVIISVYKKAKELELILYALSIQTFKDFEIILADDGSGENILSIISFSQKYITQ